MDATHHLAHHAVAALIGDPSITAFSALPNAPVQPARPRRRIAPRSIPAALRAVLIPVPRPRDRANVHPSGSRMAACAE